MSEPYFGKDVDQAIVLFQLEPDPEQKKEIFEKDILPAFDKLANYYYYRMPVRRNKEIIHDCKVFLYEQIYKFDASRYQRAFPYFNLIAKHYFIQKLKLEKREVSNEQEIVALNDPSIQNNDSLIYDSIEEDLEKVEFVGIFKENLVKWRDRFTKEQEKKFVDALITLFQNADNIDIYKKKAIFFYLREMTGLNSKQIAQNLSKIQKKFNVLKNKYQKGDI